MKVNTNFTKEEMKYLYGQLSLLPKPKNKKCYGNAQILTMYNENVLTRLYEDIFYCEGFVGKNKIYHAWNLYHNKIFESTPYYQNNEIESYILKHILSEQELRKILVSRKLTTFDRIFQDDVK